MVQGTRRDQVRADIIYIPPNYIDEANHSITAQDDTLYDQPDTPAPLFAVRAFKTAIFGTPAARSYQTNEESTTMIDKKPAPVVAPAPSSFQSPAPKPNGILLTPGTGTTRRKSVSFRHDVKAGANHAATENESGDALFNSASKQSRPKSKLQQALENSRSKNNKKSGPEPNDPAEDVWEEVSDTEDRDTDETVDFNAPRSQSGKYWKSCFESYHKDAKAEMEKLIKYKELAKSYAKMKDSEALDLQQKLKEEQDRVAQMERKVAELANQIRSSREKGTEEGSQEDKKMMSELALQTRLAMDYREKVEELEDLLDHAGQEPEMNRGKRLGKNITSPRTQKTLLETQRELRRARAQVKELGDLKDEVSRLKGDLAAEKLKSKKLTDENRKLAADLSRSSAKVVDLEKEVDDAKSEARQKERDFKRLQREHDQFKENAKARVSEATQVLERKNDDIATLKKEIRSLKLDKSREHERETRLATDRDNLRKRYSALANNQPTETVEVDEGITAKLDAYDASRRRSMNVQSLPQLSQASRSDTESRQKENKPAVLDEPITRARDLRRRGRPEIGGISSSSSALSERENLRETRPAVTHNRHSFPSGRDIDELTLPPIRSQTSKPDSDLRRRESSRSIRRTTRNPEPTRPSSADDELPKIDLVHGRFERLGNAPTVTVDMNTSMAWDINASKTSLPADRHAAAIARLQRKKMEKARGLGRGKENTPMV